MIRIGPAGIGGFSEIPKVLEYYNQIGIKCAEIPFTYQVWMNNEQAKALKKINKYDINLSIHAPYYSNLNSEDENIIERTKKRILEKKRSFDRRDSHYKVF